MRDGFLAFAAVAQAVPTGWAAVFWFGMFLLVTVAVCWRSDRT